MANSNNIVKFLYSVFIGILLTILTGVGIQTFYPRPESPTRAYDYVIPSPVEGTEQVKLDPEEYKTEWDGYQLERKEHDRNASLIAMVTAVLFTFLGLKYAGTLAVADGLVFGSIFNLLYSIASGIASGDDRFTFFIVVASLILSIVIGEKKLSLVKSKRSKKRK